MSTSPDSSDHQNPSPNSTSIDHSMDLIEDQLASISLPPPSQEDHFVLANETLSETSNLEGGEREGGGGWNWEVEVEEREDQVSPSSSGYAGGRGSSGGTSRASGYEQSVGENEIREIENGNGNGNGIPRTVSGDWIPGKRHIDEVSGDVSYSISLNFLCLFVVLMLGHIVIYSLILLLMRSLSS